MSANITANPPSDFLERLHIVLEKNLSNADFDVPDLCQAIFMSRTALHHKIIAQTRKSTSIYIRFYRLQKASQLLSQTNLSVTQVAWKVGFSSLSYFSKCYREEFGESPGALRREGTICSTSLTY